MRRFFVISLLSAGLAAFATPAHAQLIITPTFTTNFNTNFGANAGAAQASWIAAANLFSSKFNDNIHVNITVDAVTGTGVLGESSTPIFQVTYANLRTAMINDAKSASDLISVGAGGSITAADPSAPGNLWWVTRAQRKAIGLAASDLTNDGTITFGTGFSYTFSGAIAAGTIDFMGVAAHEISEVMGRIGISGGTVGGTVSYTLLDDLSYTGATTKGLGNGAGNFFSIDNGTTLLKAFNNQAGLGGDSRDWASGTNDSFNAFSSSGVANPVTAVDYQVMDVLGYDLIAVPEPATIALFGVVIAAAGYQGWRYRRNLSQALNKPLSDA
jgi:PEP-CTERM motif